MATVRIINLHVNCCLACHMWVHSWRLLNDKSCQICKNCYIFPFILLTEMTQHGSARSPILGIGRKINNAPVFRLWSLPVINCYRACKCILKMLQPLVKIPYQISVFMWRTGAILQWWLALHQGMPGYLTWRAFHSGLLKFPKILLT